MNRHRHRHHHHRHHHHHHHHHHQYHHYNHWPHHRHCNDHHHHHCNDDQVHIRSQGLPNLGHSNQSCDGKNLPAALLLFKVEKPFPLIQGGENRPFSCGHFLAITSYSRSYFLKMEVLEVQTPPIFLDFPLITRNPFSLHCVETVLPIFS